MSGRNGPLLGAILLAAAGLLAAELAAGALGHGAGTLHDPCTPRRAATGPGGDRTAQRFVLRGLDEVACRTGRSREQLVLDLADRGIDVVEAIERLQSRLEDWRERLEEILGGLARAPSEPTARARPGSDHAPCPAERRI
ncbi:MAG: hypothetical protein ABR521_13390 [Gaiellaceae bacterium]